MITIKTYKLYLIQGGAMQSKRREQGVHIATYSQVKSRGIVII